MTDGPCATDALPLTISFFRSEGDTQPARRDLTWGELRAELGRFSLRDDKAGPAWSPVRYAEGASRGSAGVEIVTAAVMDVDDGTDPETVHRRLTGLGLEHFIHSTFSSTPEHPKFRVVVPLADPCSAQRWRSVFPGVCALLTDGHTDPGTRDPSRLFYLPSARPDGKTFTYAGHGRALLSGDLSHGTIIATAGSLAAARIAGISEERLVEIMEEDLAYLPGGITSYREKIREAARSALAKFGRAAPEGPKPPEDGAALFRDLVEGWKIHVYLPAEWEYRILALFCLQSRLAPRLPRSFYLYPAGPKGSGKTTILDHISEVTHALRFQNVSLPTLARSMSERPAPTVAVDEYDITTGDRGVDEARDALVRQGYKANAAPFKRSELVHGKVVPVEFPIYGPKVLTFRGQVEDALQDRGFILPTEKGKDYAFVVRAISPRWGDLISRLDAWGSAALPGLDPARLLERLESPDFQDRVRRVLGVLEATRNAELVTVALLVAEAAGVDLEAELREALGAKEREAAENEWVEALGDILPRLAKNSPKLEASPFYVLKQSAVKAELDRIRKERRLPPCSAAEFAGWRRDLGIRSDWIRKRARAAYWNLPKEFVEDLGSQGPGSLTSLASLLSRDERGNHVSPVNPSGEGTRSLRGAPTLADSPTSHEPPPRPEVSPVSDPNLPGRDPEDLLGPAPTLADRARDNSREAGSLPLDPPGEEGS